MIHWWFSIIMKGQRCCKKKKKVSTYHSHHTGLCRTVWEISHKGWQCEYNSCVRWSMCDPVLLSVSRKKIRVYFFQLDHCHLSYVHAASVRCRGSAEWVLPEACPVLSLWMRRHKGLPWSLLVPGQPEWSGLVWPLSPPGSLYSPGCPRQRQSPWCYAYVE